MVRNSRVKKSSLPSPQFSENDERSTKQFFTLTALLVVSSNELYDLLNCSPAKPPCVYLSVEVHGSTEPESATVQQEPREETAAPAAAAASETHEPDDEAAAVAPSAAVSSMDKEENTSRKPLTPEQVGCAVIQSSSMEDCPKF